MQLKKSEAVRILEKLKFEVREGKERFALFRHNGKIILTTAVPKGSGEMYVANQFRQQLKINEEQLADAKRCPFDAPAYLAHLRARGLIA